MQNTSRESGAGTGAVLRDQIQGNLSSALKLGYEGGDTPRGLVRIGSSLEMGCQISRLRAEEKTTYPLIFP